METEKEESEVHNCVIKLRDNPPRRKDKARVGCGAGFAGDRPAAALKLLQRVADLDYLVLECLAERTLADRYQTMESGGKGFDPRLGEWMSSLLPLAVERGVCIITNMGAMDPTAAQKEVLYVASNMGINVRVALAYEVSLTDSGSHLSSKGYNTRKDGASTYLGAAPIVQCLEKYQPHVVITSRVADASLFLAPMVYELGWNWNDLKLLAQGALAGHLLECGCQLTGGYFMHPGNKYQDFSFKQLLNLSLPLAEVSYEGEICVAKADGSGGRLDCDTCAEQLLYEIGDPSSYITPDVVIDMQDVSFYPLSNDRVLCRGAKPFEFHPPNTLLCLAPTDCGWKGWGEISYGGYGCVKRAEAAEFLVRSWMDEVCPGVKDRIISYIIGYDSLKAVTIEKKNSAIKDVVDVRLRMDGLFERKEHATHFIEEFMALYTNGPAGGGGISTGHKKEIILQKELVERDSIFWRTEMKETEIAVTFNQDAAAAADQTLILREERKPSIFVSSTCVERLMPSAAPAGKKIPLYEVVHSRAGDKGNDLNFSIIPHFPEDISRIKTVITAKWVKDVVSVLLDISSFPLPEAIKRRNRQLDQVSVEIYELRGIHSLNVVVRNILDGGVNCSRRMDRHGKTLSDLILCQDIVLPP